MCPRSIERSAFFKSFSFPWSAHLLSNSSINGGLSAGPHVVTHSLIVTHIHSLMHKVEVTLVFLCHKRVLMSDALKQTKIALWMRFSSVGDDSATISPETSSARSVRHAVVLNTRSLMQSYKVRRNELQTLNGDDKD